MFLLLVLLLLLIVVAAAAVAAAAVEFDSDPYKDSQLNCTVFGQACWICFQSCVFQSWS